MKSYEITIQPISGFGTDLRGDTLFGHFCWQAAHDPSLLEGGLERQIANYHKKPFAVFSSAFPKLANDSTDFYALRRPHLPLSFLLFTDKHNRKERMIEAKEHRKKAWMMLAESESSTSGTAGGLKYVNRSKRLKNHGPPQRWRQFI